jgi:hypothetical protein
MNATVSGVLDRVCLWFPPRNSHVHSVIKNLFPIVDGRLGFSNVRPNPAVVISELLLVFDEPTVELDDIRILDSIGARLQEGR